MFIQPALFLEMKGANQPVSHLSTMRAGGTGGVFMANLYGIRNEWPAIELILREIVYIIINYVH